MARRNKLLGAEIRPSPRVRCPADRCTLRSSDRKRNSPLKSRIVLLASPKLMNVFLTRPFHRRMESSAKGGPDVSSMGYPLPFRRRCYTSDAYKYFTLSVRWCQDFSDIFPYPVLSKCISFSNEGCVTRRLLKPYSR